MLRYRPSRRRPPPLPPPGTYDPALDAAVGAANRGYLDVQQDTGRDVGRAGVDYGLGVEDLRRGQTRGVFDYQRAQSRGLADYGTAETRSNQDFTRNTQALQRSFNILAGQQQEGANAAGVTGGGALLQAAAKRKENQGIQQEGLNIGHARTNQDIATGRTRLNEDTTTGIGRLNEDTNLGIGRLGLGYQRQTDDYSTVLQRAGRENTQFGLDTGAQRAYQASQSGAWDPPGPSRPQAHPQSPHPTTRGRFPNRRQGRGRI